MMSYKEFEEKYANTGKGYRFIDGSFMDRWHEYFRDNAEVGDGATLCLWSDREAYTIIKRTPQSLTLRRCKATLKPDFKPDFVPGGFCGTVINQYEQDYDYEEDENGRIIKAYWSKKLGRFRNGSCTVIPGRREYFDFNF